MLITYNQREKIFNAISQYEERHILKNAGFTWNPLYRRWQTNNPLIVAKIPNYSQYVDETASNVINEALEKRRKTIELSQASKLEEDINIPCPEGLNYLPFQKVGIAYALDKKKTLIADEMGLGKTIQAIGYINAKKPSSVLIVCPAFLKLNWIKELEKWLVHDYKIYRIDAKTEANILNDTENSIYVINYDILHKFKEQLNKTWSLLIADECHYCKNPKATRSKILYSLKSDNCLFLTGTPILNKPVEIFPVLNYFGIFKSWYKFVTRYCNAYKDRYGWVVNGASNLSELQEKLRASCMIRRLKKDVLKELPPKFRQIISLPQELFKEQIFREETVINEIKQKIKILTQQIKQLSKEEKAEEIYKEKVENLKNEKFTAFSKLAEVRHETALAKAPFVADYIVDTLESVPKLVVFAYHRDVIHEIEKKLTANNIKCLTVTGETDIETRQAFVEQFQQDDSVKVFLANMKAGGVGITLTASSHVIFAELDWTPATLSQAEDRCHRIGQDSSVLVQHIVADGSIDAQLAKTLIKKQEIIEKALNIKEEHHQQQEEKVEVEDIIDEIFKIETKEENNENKDNNIVMTAKRRR